MINYHWIRTGMPGVHRGFLLADSGPIMPSDGWSRPLHDKVYEAWDVASILTDLPDGFDPDDFGTINTMVADEFPDDRLAVTFFRRDFDFSVYSYERFYDFPSKEEILSKWWDDTQLLMARFDTRGNLGYYIPYWRALNNSHCTTLITFQGSEIQEDDIDLDGYVDRLVNGHGEVPSYLESVQEGADPPPG